MERLTTPSNRQQVRGFLTIHSTPSALRHHIDWAVQAVLGTWVKPSWSPQPLIPGSYRTQIEFRDRAGAAAELASTLRSWHYLNFEVIENTDNGGELFSGRAIFFHMGTGDERIKGWDCRAKGNFELRMAGRRLHFHRLIAR